MRACIAVADVGHYPFFPLGAIQQERTEWEGMWCVEMGKKGGAGGGALE